MSHAVRLRTYDILELAKPDDDASQACDVALIVLIALNVIAVALESVETLSAAYGTWFDAFEVYSVAVFTVEYVLRLWSAVDRGDGRFAHPVRGRLRYAATPLALIDLLAILPFYLGVFFALDLRFLRALRLLRVFKLTRYSSAMSLLMDVLRAEAEALGSAFFILIVILIFASSGIYLVEHQVQPDAFGSVPAAMWWAVATLTTVGYGDVTPITVLGKLFGACVTIIGIGMVALPAGLLGSAFTEALRKRREVYEDLVREVLADGVVTDEEETAMAAMRRELGLDEAGAKRLFDAVAKRGHGACPHCGKSLGHGPP